MSSHRNRQKGDFGSDLDWSEVIAESIYSVDHGDEANQWESCEVNVRHELQEGEAQSFGEA